MESLVRLILYRQNVLVQVMQHFPGKCLILFSRVRFGWNSLRSNTCEIVVGLGFSHLRLASAPERRLFHDVQCAVDVLCGVK